MGILTRPQSPHKWVTSFLDHLESLHQSHPLYVGMYAGKQIGCCAITDHVDTGYAMAYLSGLDHRMSNFNRAWSLVHTPALTVLSGQLGNSLQSAAMTVEFAKRELDVQYLGCRVPFGRGPLFDTFEQVVYPNPALFVYPENWLVPKQQQQFVNLLVKRVDIQRAIIITKNPLILTDFLSEAIQVIQSFGID